MKSLKFKLGLVVSIIMLLAFIIIFIYYNAILNERVIKTSVQLLSKTAAKYESDLINEIEISKERGDLLARIFLKKIKEGSLDQDTEKLLRSLLVDNPNISGYRVAYINSAQNSVNLSVEQKELEPDLTYINLMQTPKGIVRSDAKPQDPLKLKLFKKKLSEITYSTAFEPVVNENTSGYIPVLTPIFYGQEYLGYIETDISLILLDEIIAKNKEPEIAVETYFVASTGNVLAGTNRFNLGDKIKLICPSCLKATNIYNSYNVTSSEFVFSYPLLLDKPLGTWHIYFKVTKNELFDFLGYHFWAYLFIGFVLLGLSVLLIFVAVDYLIRPFKMLIAFAQKVATGDFECEQNNVKIVREDEFGQLQKAFKGISESLKETAEVSNAIAAGDFSKSVKVKSDKDLLADSINKMSGFLKKKQKDDEIREKDEEKQKWLNRGLSLISDVLKTNQDNTMHLADKLIKSLVEFLDLSLGGIYIKELSDDEKTMYRLIVAYAYSEQKFIEKKFYSGESLVGSCASEKRMVYMSNIPDAYIKILSGLGEAVPKSLILIPIIYNDEVFGVLELASLKAISEQEQDFLQQAADNIASTLSLTRISSQSADLLIKTQQQAKELELRDKQMLDTLKQLQNLQKETAAKEAEVRAKISAMNNTLLVVEYTTDGILLDANEKYLKTMNFTMSEIQGINVSDLLNDQEKKELVNIIHTVKQGNFYESIVKRHTKHGKEKWLLATYTPVLDESGQTASILFFAADISRIVAKEERLRTEIEQIHTEKEQSDIAKEKLEKQFALEKEKLAEIKLAHKKELDKLSEKMENLHSEDAMTIKTYEQMISDIVEQWSNHIDEAEKKIKK
jgi:PAS domain S-box-containing protein